MCRALNPVVPGSNLGFTALDLFLLVRILVSALFIFASCLNLGALDLTRLILKCQTYYIYGILY